MNNFKKNVHWEGVVVGFAAALVLGAILAHGRR